MSYVVITCHFYHESNPPDLIHVPVPRRRSAASSGHPWVTLGDLRRTLGPDYSHFRYFFKTFDTQLDMAVKEHIFRDAVPLPTFDGRIVAWILPPLDAMPVLSDVEGEDSVFARSRSVSLTHHLAPRVPPRSSCSRRHSSIIPPPPPFARRPTYPGSESSREVSPIIPWYEEPYDDMTDITSVSRIRAQAKKSFGSHITTEMMYRAEPVVPIDLDAWVADTMSKSKSEVRRRKKRDVTDKLPPIPVPVYTQPVRKMKKHKNPPEIQPNTNINLPIKPYSDGSASVVDNNHKSRAVQTSDSLNVNKDVELVGAPYNYLDAKQLVLMMQRPNSSLEVKDRIWAKMKVSEAFVGFELLSWLKSNVKCLGSGERKRRKTFVQKLLDLKLITPAIRDKKRNVKFSKCRYYQFCLTDPNLRGRSLPDIPDISRSN